MNQLRLFVRGKAIAQGSMTPGVRDDGTPYVRDQKRAELMPWRTAIAYELRALLGRRYPPYDGPVKVTLVFGIRKPKSKSKSEVWAAVMPDIDKLTRSVLDALTKDALFLTNDARVVELHVAKPYTTDSPGVAIVIEPAEDIPAWVKEAFDAQDAA